jgi:hypothetical protein
MRSKLQLQPGNAQGPCSRLAGTITAHAAAVLLLRLLASAAACRRCPSMTAPAAAAAAVSSSVALRGRSSRLRPQLSGRQKPEASTRTRTSMPQAPVTHLSKMGTTAVTPCTPGLHVHTAPHRSPGFIMTGHWPCSLSMLPVYAPCLCSLSMLPVYAPCLCSLSMLPVFCQTGATCNSCPN